MNRGHFRLPKPTLVTTLSLVILTLLSVTVAVPALAPPTPSDTAITLTVSAAADLTFAFQELGQLFEKETGARTVFNFGSTGQLAQQIEQGAPVDVFAAANIEYIDELRQLGLVLPGTNGSRFGLARTAC
jgi:molybdate transport system substrate-binding protein